MNGNAEHHLRDFFIQKGTMLAVKKVEVVSDE
jgi:hypothetical protein